MNAEHFILHDEDSREVFSGSLKDFKAVVAQSDAVLAELEPAPTEEPKPKPAPKTKAAQEKTEAKS